MKEHNKLVLLKSYNIEVEAHLIASLLKSYGIHSVVQATYLVGQTGGAEIFIQEKDLEKAEEIINHS